MKFQQAVSISRTSLCCTVLWPMYLFFYVHIYVCVCVCVCERERESKSESFSQLLCVYNAGAVIFVYFELWSVVNIKSSKFAFKNRLMITYCFWTKGFCCCVTGIYDPGHLFCLYLLMALWLSILITKHWTCPVIFRCVCRITKSDC